MQDDSEEKRDKNNEILTDKKEQKTNRRNSRQMGDKTMRSRCTHAYLFAAVLKAKKLGYMMLTLM